MAQLKSTIAVSFNKSSQISNNTSKGLTANHKLGIQKLVTQQGVYNRLQLFNTLLLSSGLPPRVAAAEREVLELAAALPALVPAAGMNSLVAAVLGAPALAGMADTGVGTACEAEPCNRRHMVVVGSMEGTEHPGRKAAAADA